MPANATAPISIEELATRWHTTPSALYSMRYRGEGPRGFRVGRKVLFDLNEIIAYEQDRLEPAGVKR